MKYSILVIIFSIYCLGASCSNRPNNGQKQPSKVETIDCNELTISDSLYQVLIEDNLSSDEYKQIINDSVYIQGDCIHLYVLATGTFNYFKLVSKPVLSRTEPAEIDLIFYYEKPDGHILTIQLMGFLHYDISHLRSMTNGKDLKINLLEYGNPDFLKVLNY